MYLDVTQCVPLHYKYKLIFIYDARMTVIKTRELTIPDNKLRTECIYILMYTWRIWKYNSRSVGFNGQMFVFQFSWFLLSYNEFH